MSHIGEPVPTEPLDQIPPQARGSEDLPARADSVVSRRVRWFAGIDERVLDMVPSERARHTSLGGVVVGTALLGGMSFFAALTMAFGGFSLILVPIAVIWTLFIGNLDRWL